MEAEVLPVEAHATHLNLPWCADEAANVMPVSLNDAVGFMPWCLAWGVSAPPPPPVASGGGTRQRFVCLCFGGVGLVSALLGWVNVPPPGRRAGGGKKSPTPSTR